MHREITFLLPNGETKPVNLTLDKPGQSVRVIGFTIGSGNELINAPVHIRHEAPNTTSEVFLRTILSDQAVREGEAVVSIAKGAKGASTRLETRALLLSPNARAKTKPVLEIDENDVQASHAATTGPLDEDAIFYLQSRGVSEHDARQLLVWGFLAEGVQKIQDLKKRGGVERKLSALLRITCLPAGRRMSPFGRSTEGTTNESTNSGNDSSNSYIRVNS